MRVRGRTRIGMRSWRRRLQSKKEGREEGREGGERPFSAFPVLTSSKYIYNMYESTTTRSGVARLPSFFICQTEHGIRKETRGMKRKGNRRGEQEEDKGGIMTLRALNLLRLATERGHALRLFFLPLSIVLDYFTNFLFLLSFSSL